MDERALAVILVCGSRGFIGGSLYRALSNLDQGRGGKYLKRSQGDLTVFENCQKSVEGVDTVYMMAGVTGGVGLLKDDPLAMVTPNLIINANMFRAAAKAKVRKMICMSSTTGYLASNFPLKEEDYFTGDVIPGYFNPGHTRRFIERLASMYDMEVTFLRCAGAYGPGDDFSADKSHFVGATVKKVAERQNPIHVWGDGQDVRDLTYIDDLIDALLMCRDLPGQALNIGQGCGMSISDMVNTLCECANYEPSIIYDNRPSIMRFRVLDTSKAKALGWKPKVSIEEGLRRTYEWYVNN